jgi:hypothetical protein
MKKTALLAALIALALAAPVNAGNPIIHFSLSLPERAPHYYVAPSAYYAPAPLVIQPQYAAPQFVPYTTLYAAPSLFGARHYYVVPAAPAVPVQPATPQFDGAALQRSVDALNATLQNEARFRAAALERLAREADGVPVGAKKLPNGQPLEVKEEKR